MSRKIPDVGDLIKISWKEYNWRLKYTKKQEEERSLVGIFLGRSDHSNRFADEGSGYFSSYYKKYVRFGGFTHWVIWDVNENCEVHQPIFRTEKYEVLMPVTETEAT